MSVSCRVNHFVDAIIFLSGTHGIFVYFFFINWTLRMSDNLPERVQILGHAHILCITVRENRIICCQIFCDLLLKSAFELIFNVMQLILVKIKWHIILSDNIKSKNSTILVAFHITLKQEISKCISRDTSSRLQQNSGCISWDTSIRSQQEISGYISRDTSIRL